MMNKKEINDLAEKLKKSRNARAPKEKRIYAFGKWKTYREWAKDPICKAVNADMIRKRVSRGSSNEDAITKPPYEIYKAGKKIKCWGLDRTVMEHSKDPRSVVSYDTARSRINSWKDRFDYTNEQVFETYPGEKIKNVKAKTGQLSANDVCRMKW